MNGAKKLTRVATRIGLIALCLAGIAAEKPDLRPLPNIVFILADDLGINDLACYGRREHHTPHLDHLAAQGARFTAAYCAQPICSPSRAAILTGKSPAILNGTWLLSIAQSRAYAVAKNGTVVIGGKLTIAGTRLRTTAPAGALSPSTKCTTRRPSS